MRSKTNVFIIGSNGIPAKYGGFETFVDELTKNSNNEIIDYHVSCMSEDKKDDFIYNGARCFNIKGRKIGPAKAIIYDMESIRETIKYIEKNKLKNCIIYILGYTIGPLITLYKCKLKRLGIKLYINPDGLEWKRDKWNIFIRKYLKICERYMVKNSDLVVCDSVGIEEYISNEYLKYNPKTRFIAYGSYIKKSVLNDNSEKFINWLAKNKISKDNYYLIVGRFVAENNYKLMIEEYMKSSTDKPLVIISNVEHNKLYKDLLKSTSFDKDDRIKFVGTVYDQELLKKIRENAYAYIHGHEVGGTNPSLLESLASTKINLLLDVNFNKEVGKDGAIYFNKECGNLKETINKVDNLCSEYVKELEQKAKARINNEYNWSTIAAQYEELFIREYNNILSKVI